MAGFKSKPLPLVDHFGVKVWILALLYKSMPFNFSGEINQINISMK